MESVNHAFNENHLRILMHHAIYGDDVTGRVGLPILHVFWNTRDMVESECLRTGWGEVFACLPLPKTPRNCRRQGPEGLELAARRC
jgi:hypothetical protein